MVTRGIGSMVAQAPDMSNDPNAWMDQAACAGMVKTQNFRRDGDPFFPVSSAEFAAEPGKKICATCPVISICYEHGEGSPDSRRYGTFGGLAQEQRSNRRRLKRRAEAIEQKRKAS